MIRDSLLSPSVFVDSEGRSSVVPRLGNVHVLIEDKDGLGLSVTSRRKACPLATLYKVWRRESKIDECCPIAGRVFF